MHYASGHSGAMDKSVSIGLNEVSWESHGRVIIDRVTLTFSGASRTIVLGANGAGKSVLMRLLHGLLVPTTGTIFCSEHHAQAMVFQRPVLLRTTVLNNIAFGLRLAGVASEERRQRAQTALAEIGLSHLHAHPARLLSGGEQQLVVLARAWALRPKVLFLDEPTANLDPAVTRQIEQVIRRIHEQGSKIIMTTHNLAQARRLADDIVFLHQGRALEHTSALDFFSTPNSTEARAFIKEHF